MILGEISCMTSHGYYDFAISLSPRAGYLHLNPCLIAFQQQDLTAGQADQTYIHATTKTLVYN